MTDRLRLRVGGRHRTELQILINGWRQLARPGRRAYGPFHPASLLDPVSSPLRPTQPASRIALYGCTCGHSGCGCVAAVIAQNGDQVTWTDFRDFTHYYSRGPVAENPPDPDQGTPLPLPDFTFDASEYHAEVERAIADRSWETPPLLTIRLLETDLTRHRDRLAELGWQLEFAYSRSQAGGGSFGLCLRDDQDHQIVVDLKARPGSAADQARELADFVLTASPLQWPVSHCSLCDGRFVPSPGRTQAEHDAELAAHPAHAPAVASHGGG